MDSSTCSCRGVLEANSSPPVFEGADAAGGKLESQKLREMELHEEDAEGWKYRGEGAANIVLAYHGSRPSFVRDSFPLPFLKWYQEDETKNL